MRWVLYNGSNSGHDLVTLLASGYAASPDETCKMSLGRMPNIETFRKATERRLAKTVQDGQTWPSPKERTRLQTTGEPFGCSHKRLQRAWYSCRDVR